MIGTPSTYVVGLAGLEVVIASATKQSPVGATDVPSGSSVLAAYSR